jgi:hypothetical protein
MWREVREVSGEGRMGLIPDPDEMEMVAADRYRVVFCNGMTRFNPERDFECRERIPRYFSADHFD